MSLWGFHDNANNAPVSSATAGYGGNTPQVTSNAQVYFSNTRSGAFITGSAIGVFGVDAYEQINARESANTLLGVPQHAGWVIRKTGMGPITAITANAAAVGANSFIIFSQGNGRDGSGNTAAVANIAVNSAGYITTVSLISGGLYANTPIATANSGNASFTITMGGRANRVTTETIVAMGSMRGDGGGVY
jgi:hypothetical protein